MTMKRHYHRSIMKMMPEGPEVHSLVDKLNYHYFNDKQYQLVSSSIISGRYTKELPVGYNEILSKLPLQLKSINSKGKFIYLSFNNDVSLWCTLGLTGGFTISPKANHIRYTLTFQEILDNTKKTLYFYDQRNFGTLKCCFNNDELQKKLSALGPCWINDNISFNEFLEIVKSTIKRSKKDLYVAQFFMNQKKTAGIGNYIVSEVLYETRIYPFVKMSQLTDGDWMDVYMSIKNIIGSSYASQKHYQKLKFGIYDNDNDNDDNIYGDNHIFNFKVYGQTMCPAGYRVVREEGPHERMLHYVPELQIRHKILIS